MVLSLAISVKLQGNYTRSAVALSVNQSKY